MKRVFYTTLALLFVAVVINAQSSKDIITEALQQGVEAKVMQMQEEIKFTDEQAAQLINIEMQFLKGVNKVNRCWLCNKKKRVKKLEQKRDEALQDKLTRGQYIRYLGGSIDEVKDHPVQL